MTEKGFAVIAAAACIGEHSLTSEIATGRPDESDLAKAKAFGKQLAEKLQQNLSALPKGTIPGNRPYRERGASNPMGPENVNGCTHCGLCVRNCPVGAIDAEDPGKSTPSSSPRTPTKVRSRGASPPSRSPARNRNFICKPSKKIPRDTTRDFSILSKSSAAPSVRWQGRFPALPPQSLPSDKSGRPARFAGRPAGSASARFA